MLRVYSILQLEPLWLKPKLECGILVQDENIEPVQVVEQTEVLVEEPESLEGEVAEPEFQEVIEEEQIVIHKVDTSVSQESVQVIELEIDDLDNSNNNNEDEEEKNNGNISSGSSSSDSSEEDNIEEKYVKEKIDQDKNNKKEVTPITTTDLKSISEEPNDSSNISSSSSLSPETPTSAQSRKPRTRLRKDSKFNERRKSMTNKLKRAFSSASSSSSKRNSIIST